VDDCAHYVCITHFAFTPLDDSTHLRCYYRPTVSFVLYHCTFIRIYFCTTHFAFTPLDDSTHLRCYCTPTAVLFYTTVRFYGPLCFYTTVRLYASTMLPYVDCQFCFIPLYVYTHLRFYGFRCFCTTGRFYASTMLLYADCQFHFIPLFISTHLRFYGSLTTQRNKINRGTGSRDCV